MLQGFYQKLGEASPGAIILSLALMLFLGFAMTRVTKRLRLPDVTAYILTGIVIGPFCLDLISPKVIAATDFLSDIALAFIAFSVGEFFRVETLKKNGMRVVIITVMEACVASLAVFAVTYYAMGLSMAFSAVLAALAAATAPASTMMTIRQTHARGDLVDTLLQVVALDDVVGLVAYSAAISVALSSLVGAKQVSHFQLVMMPILLNAGVLLLGGLFGLLLKAFLNRRHSTDNRLIIAVGLLFAFCGICVSLGASPLLGCMSMGMVYINVTGDEKLFMQLNYFSPPILLLFFVRSGLGFRLDTLVSSAGRVGGFSLLTVGIVYFFVRIFGKYGGAYLGCLMTKKPVLTRNYLGLALIPQAGVAIGLAAMCARVLGKEMGGQLQTIILASSVLYEMVGPACAKLSLYLSKSYSNKLEEVTAVETVTPQGQQRAPVEVLIDRLAQIQKELPPRREPEVSPEEQAFLQAAEDQMEEMTQIYHGRFLNR